MKIMFADLQGLRKISVRLVASTSYNKVFPEVKYLIPYCFVKHSLDGTEYWQLTYWTSKGASSLFSFSNLKANKILMNMQITHLWTQRDEGN